MAAGSQRQLEHEVHVEHEIHLLSPHIHAANGCAPFRDRQNIFSGAKPEQQTLDRASLEKKNLERRQQSSELVDFTYATRPKVA